MPEQQKLFSAEVEKVVRIVVYGPAISQSDYRKADPYQLPSNNYYLLTEFAFRTVKYQDQGLVVRTDPSLLGPFVKTEVVIFYSTKSKLGQ